MDYPISDAGSFLQAGKFSDGDAGQGVPASIDKAAHMNAVYDEIINAITALGETPTENVNDQLKTGIEALIATINAPFLPSVGDVGSYAFMRVTNTQIITGNVYSASILNYSGVQGRVGNGDIVFSDASALSPTGSWQAMGYIDDTGNIDFGTTLFLRIL